MDMSLKMSDYGLVSVMIVIAILVVAVVLAVVMMFRRRSARVPVRTPLDPNSKLSSRKLEALANFRSILDEEFGSEEDPTEPKAAKTASEAPKAETPKSSRAQILLKEVKGHAKQIVVFFIGVISMFGASFLLFGNEGLQVLALLSAFTLVMIPLTLGIAWKSGYLATLFFTIETGSHATVVTGQSKWRTYANIPGKVLRRAEVQGVMKDDVLVDGDSEADKTLIQKYFGQYWIGFAFLGRKVHITEMYKERVNPNLTKNTPPDEQIERDPIAVPVNQIWHRIPRPIQVPDVKFSDGFEGNLLMYGNFESLVPDDMTYVLKGRFFDLINAHVRSAVIAYCKGITAEVFKATNHVEDGEMSKAIVAMIYNQLEKEAGIKFTGISVSVYNLSSDKEEAAAKAAEIARLEGMATVATAEAAKQAAILAGQAAAAVKVLDAEAEARADKIRAAASIEDVNLLVDKFIGVRADANVAVTAAAHLGRSIRFSEKGSPVVTLVEGGGNQTALPLPPVA